MSWTPWKDDPYCYAMVTKRKRCKNKPIWFLYEDYPDVPEAIGVTYSQLCGKCMKELVFNRALIPPWEYWSKTIQKPTERQAMLI